MAVVVTLSKGYDLEYIWRQVDRGAVKDAAGYYMQASEGGGEPPGRWWGPGARALGFENGQVVERRPYLLLFGQRKAPDGTQLGRPPSGGRSAADCYAQLLAAEPHATAERKRELRVEAAGRARQSPLYFDLTVSFSKSISVFHASLGENARLARQAGDAEGEAYWSGLVGEVDAMIWAAVYAGFGYFQREAGYTRTGSHASRVDGRETGQWHEADLAVAHWLQHTSRDGDMQLHVHSQIAHVARTVTDGRWRAPDSLGYNEHLGAVEGIVSQHLEEALTRRFGLEWTARDDGHGFEVKGIPGEMMRLFSSRRESITQGLRERAREFEARYAREPSQRELASLAQASNFATRARKDAQPLDLGALHADWSRRMSRELGVQLASVAPSVWGERGASHAGEQGLSPLEVERAAQKALALAQRDRAAFTRADLVRHLGRVLPWTGVDPDAAARLLESLADRALAGEFEPVVCLEAPEAVRVPECLLRADGRSVYQRHGGVRYATRAQLSAEERMVAQAQAAGAPAMAPDRVARALGVSVTRLDAVLTQGTQAEVTQGRQAGLRADQAAAVFSVLTDGRRVSVVNAPAGSGKTVVLAESGRCWTGEGLGRVVGVTPSQSSRNTLAAGVPESYNTARFLGHLPGRRGALGPVPIGPGTLILVDEASMISTRDLADLIRHAAACGAKVILAGDTSQLQAVESGGGMALLAATLGYVRLAEPARFAAAWERAASLRLRAGDISVLAEYDEHGRITSGEPEEMMDAAARAYVARTLAGTDVLLMAADHARRRELSRRIRADLIHLGIVSGGPSVPIADGARASAGDLRAQRAGRPHAEPEGPEPRERALGVLAQVIGRDGQELSATQTLRLSLANADHLAILHAIWAGETTPARERRYRDLLDSALPAEYRDEPSHKARWLWRTLRAAELAGLDAGQVIRDAVGQRSLADARDVAAVIDARIRQRTGSLVPLPARQWAEQVPALADPERQRYVAEIAAMMDARKERIGEHAAEHSLPWAVAALGPVPGDPLDRLDWQARASAIGAYRELHGWDHPHEPIGPEPAGDAPDKRAAWHEALAAVGGDADVRGLPDGSLLHLRDTYPVETAWAPRWVGDQLRQVRRGCDEARLAAIRAAAQARAAAGRGRPGVATRHEELAASYQAMAAAYRDRERVLAGVMEDRQDWERATAGRRRLAVAADAELRRRHPEQRLAPLRSAEPAPVTKAESSELDLVPGDEIPEPGQWLTDLAARREAFAGQLAERRGLAVSLGDPGHGGLGEAFPGWAGFAGEALLQPPKPEIRPSARVLERARERQAGMEAVN
jgi:hypothetical protein